jgi:hypothetical protein
MKRRRGASVQEFRPRRAGNQGDEAPPPGPPTLFSVPELAGVFVTYRNP